MPEVLLELGHKLRSSSDVRLYLMADDLCGLLVEGLMGEDEDGEGVRHTKSHLRKKNATVCD